MPHGREWQKISISNLLDSTPPRHCTLERGSGRISKREKGRMRRDYYVFWTSWPFTAVQYKCEQFDDITWWVIRRFDSIYKDRKGWMTWQYILNTRQEINHLFRKRTPTSHKNPSIFKNCVAQSTYLNPNTPNCRTIQRTPTHPSSSILQTPPLIAFPTDPVSYQAVRTPFIIFQIATF